MNDYTMTTLITRTDRDVEVQLTYSVTTRAIDLTGAWWRDTGEGTELTDEEFSEVYMNLHAIVYRAIRRKVRFAHELPRRRVRAVRVCPSTLPF
jgi:hypothetical protein